MHNQVWAKVNVPVDKGIKELVESLSAFPKLHTIESCENIGNGIAWVCFAYGNNLENSWGDLAEFVLGYLGPKLVNELGDMVSISIQLNSIGLPQGELSVRPGAMVDTVRLLKELTT